MKLLKISKIIPAQNSHWVGDGFRVFPVFGNKAFTSEISPFLMFDYAAPKKFGPNSSSPLGVGKHPHRGFETVTIAFQGEVEHADSVGNRDVIKSGDVQWMTAGRGIIHQEYHSKEFSLTGGIFEMCQLWVDLPKEKKMTKPRYQAISSNKIPQVTVNNTDGQTGAIVKIIAGVFNDVKGPAKTFSPVELYDVKLLSKNVTVDLPFPANNQCVVFSRTGSVDLHYGNTGELKETIDKHGVALLKNDLDNNSASEVADKKVFIRLSPKKDNTSVLIMGGEPLNQPIANRGPFVMTTQQELEQAMRDYYSGKMGR